MAGSLLRSPPARILVPNFRGVPTPAVGGIVVLAGLLAGETVLVLGDLVSPIGVVSRTAASVDTYGILILALGFFALGAVDDLMGAGTARSFRGHARALRRGIMTGGALKAIGGGMLGLIAGSLWERRLGPAVADALLVALSANLINLLDLRPGRAAKVFLVSWVPLAIAGPAAAYVAISSTVAAAVAVWVPLDLRERGMLGDSGSNLIGAVLGGGFALVLPFPGKLAALLLVGALTLAAERWSFTAVIGRVGPLRWFDQLGRSS